MAGFFGQTQVNVIENTIIFPKLKGFSQKLKEFTEKLNFSETPFPCVAVKSAKKKA